MTRLFEGQAAIVTGSASGIGLAIARRLAGDGARIAMVDTDEKALMAAARESSGEVFPLVLDVTAETQVAARVKEIGDRFGRIDILINSAGITGRTNIN
jgi:3-oxoacyl-[acyl-carrier protein] reductase